MAHTHLNLTRPEGAPPEDFHLSRRAVAGTLFFSGYALSTLPVNAQAITTDTKGLFTKSLTIPPLKAEAGYQIPAYIAMPDKAGKHPVIIVASEIFGLHEFIRDVCRRLAKAGYCAIAIDYFARAGNAAEAKGFDAVLAIVAKAQYQQVMEDIQAQINWLKSEPDIGQKKSFFGGKAFADMDRVGITGFCWGGTPVWMAAATLPEIKAGVAWYGRLENTDANAEKRPWPIDIAASLQKPVLGQYADGDKGISLDSVNRMNEALAASGKTPSRIILLPDTEHGFFADYRPSYNAKAAQTGWMNLLEWFRKHL